MTEEGEYLVIKGKMGAPVFWDYTINLDADDFISFFTLAKDPNMVDFLVYSKNWWNLFFSVAISSFKFTLMSMIGILRNLLPGKRKKGQEVSADHSKPKD